MNEVFDHELLVRKYEGVGEVMSRLEWDVKGYFTLGGTMHDAAVRARRKPLRGRERVASVAFPYHQANASDIPLYQAFLSHRCCCWGGFSATRALLEQITAWSIKGYHDYTRPVSSLRAMADRGQSSDPEAPSYHEDGILLMPGLIELVKPGDKLAGDEGEHINKIKVKAWRGPSYIVNPNTDEAGEHRVARSLCRRPVHGRSLIRVASCGWNVSQGSVGSWWRTGGLTNGLRL